MSEKRADMGLAVNILLIFLLANLIIFGAYYFYQNRDNPSQMLEVFGYNPDKNVVNISSEITQFIPNLRFPESSVSYYINSNCDYGQRARIENALQILADGVEILSFKRAIEENAEILIGCSKESYETEKNVFIAGEGGPTRIVNSTLYPTILKGKVLLYQDSECEYPVTEVHELLHVFGFDHINLKNKIMYPYSDCSQTLDERMINHLEQLYEVQSLADLYFDNVSAVKQGIYLNLSLEVNNQGLKNSESSALKIYSGENLIGDSDLGAIEFGSGVIFRLNNIRLPSRDTSEVKLRIETSEQELSKDNNYLELKI